MDGIRNGGLGGMGGIKSGMGRMRDPWGYWNQGLMQKVKGPGLVPVEQSISELMLHFTDFEEIYRILVAAKCSRKHTSHTL